MHASRARNELRLRNECDRMQFSQQLPRRITRMVQWTRRCLEYTDRWNVKNKSIFLHCRLQNEQKIRNSTHKITRFFFSAMQKFDFNWFFWNVSQHFSHTVSMRSYCKDDGQGHTRYRYLLCCTYAQLSHCCYRISFSIHSFLFHVFFLFKVLL